MKKVILTAILLILTIWLQAKVTLVIAYSKNEIGINNTIPMIKLKFSEIYNNIDIFTADNLSDIKRAINTADDTLIFMFEGHSNAVELKYRYYVGNLLMFLDDFKTNKSPNINNNSNGVLTTKTLHHLLQYAAATKILVIIDSCYPSLAFNATLYNVAWVFSADDKQVSLLLNRYNLFTYLFLKELKKGITIEYMINKINDKYKNKQWYPQFNTNVKLTKDYKGYSVNYPLTSISINNFKF